MSDLGIRTVSRIGLIPFYMFVLPVLTLGAMIWHFRWRRGLWWAETEQRLLARQRSEPQNPRWPQSLGLLYLCRMHQRSGSERKELAQRALREYERWRELVNITSDFTAL